MTDVVLIVDMVRGFLEEGYPLYCGPQARVIIPRVQSLLERELARGSRVIFLCDHHRPDDLEFEMFPRHCVEGTPEVEVIPELASYLGDLGEVMPKRRYSAFYGTPLAERLEELGAERLIVCGVCTDICVMHTAADARNRDYPVEVPADCVASFDDRMHGFALEHMEKVLGVKITGVQNGPA